MTGGKRSAEAETMEDSDDQNPQKTSRIAAVLKDGQKITMEVNEEQDLAYSKDGIEDYRKAELHKAVKAGLHSVKGFDACEEAPRSFRKHPEKPCSCKLKHKL